MVHNSVRFWRIASRHNFKLVFLIFRTTLWQELMMHHAIVIEQNSEQNLHIWPNLTWSFSVLGWSGFDLNVIAKYPWFVTSYDLFQQIWIVIELLQHLLSDVHVILEQSSLPHVSCRTICQHHQQPLSNSDSTMIIQNHFLHCFNVFIGNVTRGKWSRLNRFNYFQLFNYFCMYFAYWRIAFRNWQT